MQDLVHFQPQQLPVLLQQLVQQRLVAASDGGTGASQTPDQTNSNYCNSATYSVKCAEGELTNRFVGNTNVYENFLDKNVCVVEKS